MKNFAILVAMVLLATATFAQHGTLPVPPLRDGQYVYTIPSDFNPPLIGPSGIDELNREVRSLHFPFYVVIVKRLSGDYDGDKMAADAIDGLAQDWGEHYSGFDMAKSQIFLLAYEPRKYRFLAGTKFKSELGFEREAHRPYTRIFESYAKGTPKDPKGGIIAMMKAVDGYLFDETDPMRIAARKEEARRAEKQRQREAAASALDTEIIRLSSLLETNSGYLPADILAYRAMLDNAKKIRQAGEAGAMLSMASSMKPDINILENYVKEKQHKAMVRTLGTAAKTLFVLVVIAVLIGIFERRRRKYSKLRHQLNEILADWRIKVQSASTKYVDFYGERDNVATLVSSAKGPTTLLQGQTDTLCKQVTTEIDSIYSDVRAMDSHVRKCEVLAGKASFFNLKPLQDAIAMVDGPFEFDTEELNKDELFGPPQKTIEVIPSELLENLQKRFQHTSSDWQNLKAAADIRFKRPEEVFPHNKLSDMLQLADQYGIPRRWLNDHALIGDDASDKALYDELNGLRMTDPVAYMSRVETLKQSEMTIEKRLQRLIETMSLVRVKRLENPPAATGVIVDPADDPSVTFNQAHREDDKLAGRLASADTVEDIEEKAGAVVGLYKKCAEQAATIESAVKNTKSSLENAKALQISASSQAVTAKKRTAEAHKVHKNVKSDNDIDDGRAYMDAGARDLEKAGRQFAERRILDSQRNAQKAAEQFRQAEHQFEQAIKHCNGLEKQKTDYESKLAQMDSARTDYEKKIRRYGGSPRLRDFNPPPIDDGMVDYAVLLALMATTESSWQNQEMAARSTYEAAQAEAEAAAARQAAAEAERSSSLGSSWDSGGSSSSGSDWGSGDSSSSGGSW